MNNVVVVAMNEQKLDIIKAENGFMLTYNNKNYIAKTESELAEIVFELDTQALKTANIIS